MRETDRERQRQWNVVWAHWAMDFIERICVFKLKIHIWRCLFVIIYFTCILGIASLNYSIESDGMEWNEAYQELNCYHPNEKPLWHNQMWHTNYFTYKLGNEGCVLKRTVAITVCCSLASSSRLHPSTLKTFSTSWNSCFMPDLLADAKLFLSQRIRI